MAQQCKALFYLYTTHYEKITRCPLNNLFRGQHNCSPQLYSASPQLYSASPQLYSSWTNCRREIKSFPNRVSFTLEYMRLMLNLSCSQNCWWDPQTGIRGKIKLFPESCLLLLSADIALNITARMIAHKVPVFRAEIPKLQTLLRCADKNDA